MNKIKKIDSEKINSQKIFFIFTVFLLLAGGLARAQAGSLVFSLKFSGEKLDLHSVSLVPGEPPDYKVEPSDDWLTVNFHGEGKQIHSIKAPDPRQLFLEIAEGQNITGLRVYDEKAQLTFTAPNLPAASQAEFQDENGTRLLMVDYRRALKVEEEPPPVEARQFEPPAAGVNLLPLAIVLGLFAAALAYYSTRKPGEPKAPPHHEIESRVNTLLAESQRELREKEIEKRFEQR